jgi:large subunit ribosomal protein L6
VSRIGKMPITVPAGVTVKIEDNHVTVKGPKGELSRQIHKNMKVTMKDGTITVERPDDEQDNRATAWFVPYPD